MKKNSRMQQPVMVSGSTAFVDDIIESIHEKAGKASLTALDASLAAGSGVGPQSYAATALELATLAEQMNRITGDLAAAFKILQDPAPPAVALNALDRLLAASEASGRD